MLDIAFHIAVLIVVVSGVGLFVFHHSFYDHMVNNMKSAIKERLVMPNDQQRTNPGNVGPARLLERKESDIEKALKEGSKEPVGAGVSAEEK